MFAFFKRSTPPLTAHEQERLLAAIRHAEQRTSGEVRVFVEQRCRYVDATDRAAEIFFEKGMQQTRERNGVLIYVALHDRQVAVWGDQGIHEKLGTDYWNQRVKAMLPLFSKQDHISGLVDCIDAVGEALHLHFPYDRGTDTNELSDDILFGKS